MKSNVASFSIRELPGLAFLKTHTPSENKTWIDMRIDLRNLFLQNVEKFG